MGRCRRRRGVVGDEVGWGAALVPPAPCDTEDPPGEQWLMAVGVVRGEGGM